MRFLSVVGAALIVVLLGLIGYAFYDSATNEHIVLSRIDWECTSKKKGIRLQPVVVGKSVTSQPVPTVECIEYRRKQ